MTTKLPCPLCGETDWLALEQISSESPCCLIQEEDGSVEIEPEPSAEFVRRASSSITLAYMCANEPCSYSFGASDVETMFRIASGDARLGG